MVIITAKKQGDMIGLVHVYPNIFTINASSFQPNTEKYPGNMINYTTDYWWCSDLTALQSFALHFAKPIYITNYTFQVLEWPEYRDYPLQWKMIGINNNIEREISSVDASGFAPGILTLTYNPTSKGPFRGINTTMYGKNYNKGQVFCLSKIEIFGYFNDEFDCRISRAKYYQTFRISSSFMHTLIYNKC